MNSLGMEQRDLRGLWVLLPQQRSDYSAATKSADLTMAVSRASQEEHTAMETLR